MDEAEIKSVTLKDKVHNSINLEVIEKRENKREFKGCCF